MVSHAVGLADLRLTDPGPSRRPVAPMPTAPPSVSRPAPGVLRDEAQAGTALSTERVNPTAGNMTGWQGMTRASRRTSVRMRALTRSPGQRFVLLLENRLEPDGRASRLPTVAHPSIF